MTNVSYYSPLSNRSILKKKRYTKYFISTVMNSFLLFDIAYCKLIVIISYPSFHIGFQEKMHSLIKKKKTTGMRYVTPLENFYQSLTKFQWNRTHSKLCGSICSIHKVVKNTVFFLLNNKHLAYRNSSSFLNSTLNAQWNNVKSKSLLLDEILLEFEWSKNNFFSFKEVLLFS